MSLSDDRLATLAELGLLAAALSHELRQPLFAVKSLAQILQRSSPDQAELTAQLLGQVAHIERLVQASSAFARRGDGVLQPVDPVACVREAMDLVNARARPRGIELGYEQGPELPAARAHPTAVVQVLVNLLHNAVLSGARGDHVRVLVSAQERVHVDVVDSGPGVPVELRERIFERFFTTRQQGEGTGLGLSLSRQLAQGMGGELELCPSPAGAHFRLTLERWS